MASRFLMQPNGLLACFSEIVDNFVQANLTQEEAVRVARPEMSLTEATEKVARGLLRGLDAKGGWNECLETIRAVRGEAECAAVVAEILGETEPAAEVRPRDVHSRLQDLVDEHFGVRPTTPIEGLLTILEEELRDEDTLLQCIADAAGCSDDDGFEEIVERVKALRERELLAPHDALSSALAAAEATAEREFIANQGLRAKARRQRVELERLNVHLAAARWACVQRYSAEQLVLALAGLRADNTKLRRDRIAGRRWVAVGSMEQVQEMNRLMNRLERALAAAEEAVKKREREWLAVLPRCTWGEDHGSQQSCTRPATRSDCGVRGDYFTCDECSASDSHHEYADLPQAALIRRAAAGAVIGEP